MAFFLLPLYSFAIWGTQRTFNSTYLRQPWDCCLIQQECHRGWGIGLKMNQLSVIRWCLIVWEDWRNGRICWEGERISKVWQHGTTSWQESWLHFSETLLQSCSLLLLFIEVLLLLAEMQSIFLCSDGVIGSHTCFPSLICTVCPLTWSGFDSFQVIVFPLHFFAKDALGPYQALKLSPNYVYCLCCGQIGHFQILLQLGWAIGFCHFQQTWSSRTL